MMKTQVQKEFEAISAVPRCSYHNENAIKYVIEQAEALGLEYVYDEKNGNVLIRKPASAGRRDHMPIMLQGHLDMVPRVEPGYKHDFTKEPLKLKVKDGFYTAEGTTLGADDGISVAMAFALLKEKNLKNPPMEILFTTDEEVGMLSLVNADLDYVRAKYLINIDHCEGGVLLVGSAGGIGAEITIPAKREKAAGVRYVISIGGLTGGHSGIEIDKERGHAVKIGADLLLRLGEGTDYKLRSFAVDGKHNAISNNAEIEIVATAGAEADIKKVIRDVQKEYRHILRKSDPRVSIKLSEVKRFGGNVLTKKCAASLVGLLAQLPSGVINREQDDRTKTETSANIGVVQTGDKELQIVYSIRSSVAKRSEYIFNRVKNLAKLSGAKVKETDRYPAWLPDYSAPMIAKFKKAYKDLYKEELIIDTVHAGLECGYILEKTGVRSAVGVGVEIIGEHTTEERLSIDSLNKTYEYLKKAVEML